MTARIKDPVSALTHLLGALLAIVGLVLLIYNAAVKATVWHIVSFSIFGTSLILLYTASTIYHTLNISEKVTRILRKIDHMMIFVLIAGTYTPLCLIPLRGAWGWSLLTGIWVIAIAGIIMKAVWLDAPRWLYTLTYVLMGWLVIVALLPIIRTVPLAGIAWMVAGGLLYSFGAIIYGTKWPHFHSKVFGFHEIFHVFVLAGSFCHFWLVFRHILYLS